MKLPLFIVFEGIDGAGKTTQIEWLKQSFIANDIKVITKQSPSNYPIGAALRREIRKGSQGMPEYLWDRQMALLFAADRYDVLYHPETGVYPLMDKGYTVILDRYILSSYAYNDIKMAQKANMGLPNPDIVFYLDCSVQIAMERLNESRKKNGLDVFEDRNKLAAIASHYSQAFANYNGAKHRIYNDSIAEVHQKILKILLDNYLHKVKFYD